MTLECEIAKGKWSRAFKAAAEILRCQLILLAVVVASCSAAATAGELPMLVAIKDVLGKTKDGADVMVTAGSVVEVMEQDTTTLTVRGEIVVKLGSKEGFVPLDKAIESLSAPIWKNRADWNAYFVRGCFFANTGDDWLATTELRIVIEKEPTNLTYRRYRAALLHKWRTNVDDVIADCDEILRQSPNDPQALYLRGVSRLATGAASEAYKDLARSVELQPASPLALAYRGRAEHELGREAEAITSYERALQIDPRCADAFTGLAALRASSKDKKYRDTKKARDLLENLKEQRGKKEFWYEDILSVILAEEGDFDGATEHASQALNLCSDDRLRAELSSRIERFRRKEK